MSSEVYHFYLFFLSSVESENLPSNALYHKLGFEKIGMMKEVGFKFSEWRHANLWQYLFQMTGRFQA